MMTQICTVFTVCVCMFGVEVRGNTDLVGQFLDIYAPTSEAVENERCRQDSEVYKQAIRDDREWALRMLDASSKVPSGLLEGNLVNLGNYDECLLVQSDDGDWSGQHCTVGMADHVTRATEYSNIANLKDNATGILGEFAKLLGTHWSVCIPSTCSSRDLEAHLRSVLKDMIGSVEITVREDACRSSANPTVLTPADWCAIALLMFFTLLVVASTAYDLIQKKSASRSALFVSFSVYTNGRKLLTLSPGSDDLMALHGIRTLTMLWIVVGHTYELMLESPAINYVHGEKIWKSWSHAVLANYRLAVDSFLLLSGLLLCYGFLKERARGGTFNIGRFYLHRYIRLTPPYAVMILLTATLLYNSDDGPLWEEVVGDAQKNCQNYWWTGLMYINNYVHPLNACVEQSWYLSLDMQLYLLSPLLLCPLWRWKRFGKYLLGITILAGIIIAFTISWIYQFAVNPNADIWVSEYFPTHARFTPWVMGVALGCYLHTTKTTRANLSRRVVAGGWILSAALLISSMIANHAWAAEYVDYSRWAESLNSVLNRPSWALGVAWIVYSCSKGYGGFVNTFLSSKIFQLLSRLTYCVYLVHFAFILWLTGSVKTPIHLNDRTMLMTFLYVTVISFVAALVLSLVFEVPALNIEKLILGKDTPKKMDTLKYVVEDEVPQKKVEGEELAQIIGGEATFKTIDDEQSTRRISHVCPVNE